MKQSIAAASLLLTIIAMTCFAPALSAAEGDTKLSDPVSELAGTSWRLVEIMGMDDSVTEPDDRSIYTLEFSAEGQAAMLADCNRGMGSWTSESAGQLQFGDIAATRALCPPDSISELYLAQFEWVRSYVMKDGHLFLATMADGAIIEFEPVVSEPIAATVLGEEVRTGDASEMQQVIISRLFGKYASERGIEVLEEEIDAFVQNLKRGLAAEGSQSQEDGLTEEELLQVTAMRRNLAKSLIMQWKLNRALYDQYGGRIIYQQLGPEPLDAYREFIEEHQQAEDFTIHDPVFADKFWRYFTDETIHDFMPPGSADATRAFNTPPWELPEKSS